MYTSCLWFFGTWYLCLEKHLQLYARSSVIIMTETKGSPNPGDWVLTWLKGASKQLTSSHPVLIQEQTDEVFLLLWLLSSSLLPSPSQSRTGENISVPCP